MKIGKKLLGIVLSACLILSLLPVTALADDTPTPTISTTTTTLQNGVRYQSVVITLTNGTFQPGANPEVNYSLSVGSGGAYGCTRDSDTQVTVTVGYSGMCGGTIDIYFYAGNNSVKDNDGNYAGTNTITLTVPASSGPLALPDLTLNSIRPGDNFDQSFAATGGNGIKTYTAENLPDWLYLDDQTGEINAKHDMASNTYLSVAGDYTFTVSAKDVNIVVSKDENGFDVATPTPTTVSKTYTLSVKEPTTTADGYSFTDGTIYGYSGTGGDIAIPSKIDGVAVTTLANSAFYQNSDITGVTIPSSVMTIGDNAFTYCGSLKTVTFQGPLTSMGNGVFYGASSLTAVHIPSGITVLPGSTFCSCSSLTDVTIPSNITEIGDYAFCGCSSLQHIDIPASVTKIDDKAFTGWSGEPLLLDTAIFRGNAPEMGKDVFAYTADDFTVYYSSAATGFTSGTWNGYTAQSYDPAATYTVTYGANATLTGGSAPTAVSGLKMGDAVSALADAGTMVRAGYEFEGWNTKADGSGTSYAAGDPLFVTGDTTLYAVWEQRYTITYDPAIVHGSVSGIVSAKKGDLVTVTVTPSTGYRLKINTLTYTDSKGSTSIHLSYGKSGIGTYSFTMPAEAVTVSATFESNASDYDISTSGAIEYYYGTAENITIPSTIDGIAVTAIGDGAFSGLAVTSVVIPEGVTSIGGDAFSETPLQLVSLPSTLLTIGEEAFYDAYLGNVRIPASVTSIGDEAFYYNCLTIALFDGAVPASFGDDVFKNNDVNFKILYHTGNSGFDSLGYTSAAIETMTQAQLDQLYLTGIIVYAAEDIDSEGIRENLHLPATAIDGSTITWTSSDPAVISDSGVVTQGADDAQATLTATLADGSYKTYTITVRAQEYTVTYHANSTAITADSGDVPTRITSYDVGETVTVLGNTGSLVKSGYTFTGWTTSSTGSGDTVYSAGDSFKITANVDLYPVWKANGSTESSGGGSSSGGSSSTTSTATVSGSTATASISGTTSGGTQTVPVPGDTMTSLTDAAKKLENSGSAAVAAINTGSGSGLTNVNVTVPGTQFGAFASGTRATLQITSGLATLAFSPAAVDKIAAAGSGDVVFSIGVVSTSSLSAAQQTAAGGRPVYSFSVTVGGTAVSQLGGDVTVSVPYTLGANEDPNAIVVYCLDASGKLQLMQGKYDAATKSVVFTTNHFSDYVIGYNKVSFTDVSNTAWYESAVTFLAARGITSGTTDTTFGPDATLTRGQFITMLLRAYDVAAVTNPADNFSDAGSTYYTGYLAAAKKLNITTGVGDNMFAPDKAITRQEMFTLLYNALKVLDKLPNGSSGNTLSEFTDSGSVASWAADAMTALVKSGTVSGSGGKLNPADTTTRAEMAQTLYNLLGK